MVQLFPEDAKLAPVMGILRRLSHTKRMISLAELSALSHHRMDLLLPQMNAARIMGLIEIKDSHVMLTPLGGKFYLNDQRAKDEVAKRLETLEPFMAASELVKRKRIFTAGELATQLERDGLSWHTDYVKNRALLNSVLIQWAIYLDILDYNGKSKRWLKHE